MELQKEWACFDGFQRVYRHPSQALNTDCEFAVYMPPGAQQKSCPVLLFLSGLTCRWNNFVEKAGSQRLASELGWIVIVPDTSPRGDQVADDSAYDLGQGASFYLNATQDPWRAHFQMETYLTQELPELISQHVPEANLKQLALSGHSMGGHGALTLAFKNPDLFQSASAFAPICSPMETPWGQKAFQAYLGDDKQDWAAHDASHLATQTAWRRPLLIDQGSSDQFLKEQLDPSRLQAACREAQIPLAYDLHPGYDHSYYFVATFLQKHFKHHQEVLMSVE